MKVAARSLLEVASSNRCSDTRPYVPTRGSTRIRYSSRASHKRRSRRRHPQPWAVASSEGGWETLEFSRQQTPTGQGRPKNRKDDEKGSHVE